MNRSISLAQTKVSSRFGLIADYAALMKPRLVSMVLLSTFAGFYLGSQASLNWPSLFFTLLGTAFVAAGSMALNQYLERHTDAQMIRTQNRPLPSGKLMPREAFFFGAALSVIGFIFFLSLVNKTSLFLAFLTWASYLFVYTPLKSKTSLATIVGAIPGALPPAIGWAGANQGAFFGAFLLFLIIFFWQMPHFLAIAWMYRDDYARAKQPILSVLDREGSFVARQMVLNVCALMPVSLLPTIFGLTGKIYFFGAFVLGLSFAGVIIFAAASLNQRARLVLRSSILYLAAMLALMIFDKI
jgi:protoheme IX farnesyltransferase